jgi:hypothetical protein
VIVCAHNACSHAQVASAHDSADALAALRDANLKSSTGAPMPVVIGAPRGFVKVRVLIVVIFSARIDISAPPPPSRSQAPSRMATCTVLSLPPRKRTDRVRCGVSARTLCVHL